MTRLDLNVPEINLLKKSIGEAIISGNMNKSQVAQLQELNLKISIHQGLPDNIPLTHYDRYKEFIRDGERLSNEDSIKKYGITIDELRTEVEDFVDEVKLGNTPTPRAKLVRTLRPNE